MQNKIFNIYKKGIYNYKNEDFYNYTNYLKLFLFNYPLLAILSLILLPVLGSTQTTITLGSGTTASGTTTICPVNNYYKSGHLQTVYTADELFSAGWTAGTPGTISQIGFYISQTTTYVLPNWTMKMKNTTANNATTYDASGLTTVHTIASYTPTAGGFQMLTLNTSFSWDGISNILIDVCWDLSTNFSSTGQVYTYGSASNLTSYIRSDASNQCGTATSSYLSVKSQIRFVITSNSNAPANDAICSATSLTVNGFSNKGTNVNGTTVGSDIVGSCWIGSSVSHTVWYSFVAPSSGQATIIASATGFYNLTDNQLAVFSSSDNTCSGTLTQVGCDDNTGTTGCSNCAAVVLSGLISGNTYFIEVDGYSTTSGSFNISVETSAIDWVGGTSTSWNTASNWSSGAVPTSTTNVSIPSGTSNACQIPTNITAYCRNLTVGSGATLTIETGCAPPPGSCTYTIFYIYGDVINSGSIVHNGNFYLYLKGANNILSGTGTYSTSSGVGPGFLVDAGTNYTLVNNITAFKYFRIDGTLNIGSNTLSTVNFILSSGGILNQTTGTLEIGQTTLPTINGTFNAGTGTTYYNSTTTLIVNEIVTYYNLKVRENNTYIAHIANTTTTTISCTNLELTNPGTSGGTAHLHSNLDIPGSVTIGSGCTFAPGFNINLEGNWTNNGTFTASTLTVTFDGTTAQTIGGSASTTFNNFTINNTAGVTLNKASTVNATLTFTNGDITTTTTNLLTLGNSATVSGASNSSHVVGPVAKNKNTTTKFTFPTGDGTDYRSIAVTPSGTGAVTYRAEYKTNGYGTYTVTGGGIDHVSTVEYWNLDRTSGTTTCKIDISYNASSGADANYSQIIVAHWTASGWETTGAASVTGNSTSGNSECTSNWNTFSPFTLGSSGAGNPLPIELLSFEAEVNKETVLLNWSTASETNNDFFTVEKSSDRLNYNEVNTVKGAGNSVSKINYSSIDENPIKGISYYRLKQTDFDGQFTYSPVVSVAYKPDKFEVVELLPNPTNNSTQISFTSSANDKVTLRVYNSIGQEINTQTILTEEGINQINIDSNDFTDGMYYVCLENQSKEVLKSKLIKCVNLGVPY